MTLRRIAVLSSGGDCPGLNPCIRAVTRTAIADGLEVLGVYRGYDGLIDDDMEILEGRDVGGIIGKGGTILQTARSQRFMTPEGRRLAVRNLYRRGVDALVVIGGNGSLTGASILSDDFPVAGIPGSIDNDVFGSDMAIGVDTALNTILGAIDKIRDTASSHQRAFLIETMGRESGYLALASGLSGGAEAILIPEVETTMEEIKDAMAKAYDKGKAHFLAVVAEGWKPGTHVLAKYLKEHQEEVGFRVRVTVLGYVQRGGDPTAFDRLLATRMGAAAVEWLLKGKSGFMVGLQGHELVPVPLKDVASNTKKPNLEYHELSHKLEQYYLKPAKGQV